MFDALKVKNDIVKWIQDWFEINGKGCNAVIGISGGKDSSAVAALCVEALGKDRVIGVLMPNGEQFDIDVSEDLVNFLGIKSYTLNIKGAFDSIISQVEEMTEISKKPGFIYTNWCGDVACENKIKDDLGLKSRCITEDNDNEICPICKQKSKHIVVWGIQY